MSKSLKKTPPFIKILGWLISLFAFSLGFWHTHLGIRELNALSWEYGSLVVAGLILMVLIVAYNRAIAGKKNAIYFYALCALFFFISNVNSFYPTYLGRKLMKEETIVINDTLQKFATKINREFGKDEITKKYNSVIDLKELLKQEISKQSGFGVRATDYLRQINEIIGQPYIKPNIRIGNNQEDRDFIASQYSQLIDQRIKSFVIQNVGVGNVDIINRVNEINSVYAPELEKIIEDNSKVDIELIRENPQVKTLQQLVTKMDNICTDANKIASQNNNDTPKDVCTNYGEVKSQNLGTFAHTLSSIKERINRIDTWVILILCFFIDFIVPFAIYFLIRVRDDKNYDSSDNEFGSSLWNKIIGKKQPVNFNN